MEPFDVMDAGRMAVFMDPEGAAFCVWEAKEHKGAQIVNEHGSLNFNGLNTRNVEGAKRLLQLRVRLADARRWAAMLQMWTLPGYGDYLERDNPDLRKQMAQVGAPAGFEDVVATHQPDPGRPAGHAAALERDLRGRRRRRHGVEGNASSAAR